MRTRLLIFSFVLFGSLTAQPFHPRDFVLSGGNGAGYTQYELTDTAGYFISDDAGGFNYTLRGEYGLSTWLSADFDVSVSLLLSETLFDRFSNCYIVDMGPGLSYHIPWSYKWIDLEGGIGITYTHYLFDDGVCPERLDASGIGFSGDFHPRLYFTKRQRVGGFLYYRFNAYFMGAEYINDGYRNRDLQMNGQTHSFGLGLFYRFGNWSHEDSTPKIPIQQ